jgi:hypothetical protein
MDIEGKEIMLEIVIQRLETEQVAMGQKHELMFRRSCVPYTPSFAQIPLHELAISSYAPTFLARLLGGELEVSNSLLVGA